MKCEACERGNHINCGMQTWCECDCDGPDSIDSELFFHASPKPDACDHDFQGWIELKDEEGRVAGGTTVCTKCGMDAMSHSLRCGE